MCIANIYEYKAKGQRRKRMAVEEFAQVNNDIFEDWRQSYMLEIA